MQSICIFLGACTGQSDAFTQAASNLGRELAKRDITLIYGGANNGLMGTLANSALEHGGKVIGVMPKTLLHREKLHPGLTTTHLTADIQERKKVMTELADGFIALPGGMGTLEEIFQVWNALKVGAYNKPLGLLNINGYFTPLIQFLKGAVAQGLLQQREFELAEICDDAETLLFKLCCKLEKRQALL